MLSPNHFLKQRSLYHKHPASSVVKTIAWESNPSSFASAMFEIFAITLSDLQWNSVNLSMYHYRLEFATRLSGFPRTLVNQLKYHLRLEVDIELQWKWKEMSPRTTLTVPWKTPLTHLTDLHNTLRLKYIVNIGACVMLQRNNHY